MHLGNHGPDETEWKVVVSDLVVPRVSRNVGFKVLGTWATFNNNASVELAYRTEKTWTAFYANRRVLCNRRANLAKRLKLLENLVKPVMMYCIGSLNLTLKQISQLKGVQLKMQRQIQGRTHLAAPLIADDYMWYKGHLLKKLRTKRDIESCDISFFKSSFKWSGHVARMVQYDGERIVRQTMVYQNYEYLQNLEANTGTKCHVGRFKIWRWERQFYKTLGANWYKKAGAYSKQEWEELLEEWLERRKKLR